MLITLIWYGGIVLRACAAGRIMKSGLSRQFPLVWLYLSITAAYCVALAFARNNPWLYLAIYSGALPVVIGARFAASCGIYRAITAGYRNFRIFGTVILATAGAGGALAAWLTVGVADGQPPAYAPWIWNASLLLQRESGIAIVVMLALALTVTPRGFTPLPRAALLAASVMAGDALLGLVSAWLTRAYAYQDPNLAALGVALYGVLAGAGWLSVRPTVEIIAGGHEPDQSVGERLQMLAAVFDDAGRRAEREY